MLHKQHGISSALLMTTVRALFRERILIPDSTASIVSDVNKRLVRDIEALNLFITMFYSEIDLKEKCFRWVHAGHEPALLYDPSRDTFESLAGEGLPLGVGGLGLRGIYDRNQLGTDDIDRNRWYKRSLQLTK